MKVRYETYSEFLLATGFEIGYATGFEIGYATGFEIGYAIGFERGLKKGLEEGALLMQREIAKNLLGRFSLEEISYFTDLTLEEVQALAQEV